MSYGYFDMSADEYFGMTGDEYFALPITGSETTTPQPPTAACLYDTSKIAAILAAVEQLQTDIQAMKTDMAAVKEKLAALPVNPVEVITQTVNVTHETVSVTTQQVDLSALEETLSDVKTQITALAESPVEVVTQQVNVTQETVQVTTQTVDLSVVTQTLGQIKTRTDKIPDTPAAGSIPTPAEIAAAIGRRQVTVNPPLLSMDGLVLAALSSVCEPNAANPSTGTLRVKNPDGSTLGTLTLGVENATTAKIITGVNP